MARPPYHRWLAAVIIVVAAFAWDLRSGRTEPFPFAATDVAAGTSLTEDLVEWRPVPTGLLVAPDLAATRAKVAIPRGTPLTDALVTTAPAIPPGWWSVPVALSSDLTEGTSVRLVLTDDGRTVPGMIAAAAVPDELGGPAVGLVAVPEEAAADVAAASARGTVVVLVAP